MPLFLLLVSVLLSGCGQPEPEPDLLSVDQTEEVRTLHATSQQLALDDINLQPPHLQLALKYEGTTELGDNRGPEVERFLNAVGLRAGNPYCAAFVSYSLDEANPRVRLPEIRSALAQDFIRDYSYQARKVLRGVHKVPPGTILVWQKGNTIYGHTGLVIDWDQANGTTIEANTSSGTYGSQRDGEGVYRRERELQPGSYFRITHFTPVTYARGY